VIHLIKVEVWSTPQGASEGSRLGPHRLIDAKPSREEAELYANQLAGKFHHHGFNAEAG
jgi:hypothetical protein